MAVNETHAWSITLMVLLGSLGAGMMVFFAAAPSTRVHTFMLSTGVALLAAVAKAAYDLYYYEKQKEAARKRLADLSPVDSCPD
jgi:predicted benzoate:H+ symporter BenE